MARLKLSTLVPGLAQVLGVPASTVNVYARHLRDARMLSTGGRGPGGAAMTPHDCATLLAAVLVSDQANRAPDAVQVCRRMVAQGRALADVPPVFDIRLPFLDQLASLIAEAQSGALREAFEHLSRPSLTVEVGTPLPGAMILLTGSDAEGHPNFLYQASYLSPELADPDSALSAVRAGDMSVLRTVSHHTIFHLGALLRGDAPVTAGDDNERS